MTDQELINLYFSKDKKKIFYNEEASFFIIGSFFLFLFFILVKSFNRVNSVNVEKKIENDPKIPNKIIENLNEIKIQIQRDIRGIDLKDIFKIIDDININLEKINSLEDKKDIIEDISDQLLKFLEKITFLYSKENANKKNNLFNKIRELLVPFDLVNVFNKILESEIKKNNNEIINDNKETVKVTLKDFENLLKETEIEETPEVDLEDEIEERDVEELSSINDIASELPEEKKSIDQIKIEISRMNFYEQQIKQVEIKSIFNYIIKNLDKFKDELLIEFHEMLMEDDFDDFIDEFPTSAIYDQADDLFKSELLPTSNFQQLLNFFSSKQIETIDENENFLSIRIYADSYKHGIIRPLLLSDLLFDKTIKYYSMLFTKQNDFVISIKQELVDEYELFDKKFIFFIESKEFFFSNNNPIVCKGKWSFIEEESRIIFSKIEFKETFEPSEKEISNIRTFIAKEETNIIREIKNAGNANPIEGFSYYYCIKTDDNLFIKKIEGDFLHFLRSLKQNLWYKIKNNSYFINFSDVDNIKEVIYKDSLYTKINSFLKKINGEEKINDKFFMKIKPSVMSDKQDIIKIDKNVIGWNNL